MSLVKNCKDCDFLWTKDCPLRTRKEETERKPTDAPCDNFKPATEETINARKNI